MPTYRAYKTDHRGQIASPPARIDCDSDEEAIALVEQLVNGHAIELWQGQRFIAKIPRK